ncbi:MAG: carbamoyltransferase C-terminal domain-containing protein [Patescibacteria group bacterium]
MKQKKDNYILGINAYHGDSSACLIKNGELMAALEEERIRRVKHWAGLPTEAIKFCLEHAGISIKDVDYIAINRDPFARFHKKILRVIRKGISISFIKERLANLKKVKGAKKSIADFFGVSVKEIKAKIINVEHHRAHLASSFFVSPLDEAAVVSIDGMGDFVSIMTGIAKGNKIKILDRVEFPHSLGIFYTALTQFLGFWNYGDEYKVMGLSAFGQPIYLDKMRQIVKLKKNGFFELDTSYFRHDSEGVEMTWLNEKPIVGRLFSDKLIELLGEPRKENEELSQRFKDIAVSLQVMYEEAFFNILNHLHQKTGLKNIALAGGCLQNSLANGKIYANTPFDNVYIPPAAHDAGGAIGAAFYVWNQSLDNKRDFIMSSSFWGPEYSDEYIKNEILSIKNENFKVKRLEENDLIKETARFLADGKIVGWFEGRTEWGPRALGNRSILASPCLLEMKETLNIKIKKREPFRPFAPAVLESAVGDYFLSPDGKKLAPVPFMEKVYTIKPEKRREIPAVVHIDGTGRLQTVSEENNPLYFKLIKKFGEFTGTPVLINTSFNENEPIVNKPREAIDCFLRTKMDVIILGNYLITRT